MPCTWKTPVNNYFPNLTRSHLLGVDIMNDNSSTDTLLFHFPLLETFEIRFHKLLNVRFLEIYAPALISFSSENMYGDEIDAYIMKIIGASLQKFETSGGYPENYLLTGSTVSYAALDNNNDGGMNETVVKSGLQIRRLLNEISSLKYLELTSYLAQALAHTKKGVPLPTFDKLERLALSFPPGAWDPFNNVERQLEGIFELLHSAPLLKSLAINMDMFHDPTYIEPLGDYDYGYDYDVMESVPSCVVSHLEEVNFDEFRCETAQLRLAMFLLKNGG